jgi:hypothetical protein
MTTTQAHARTDTTTQILQACDQLQGQINDGWWLHAAPYCAVAVDHHGIAAAATEPGGGIARVYARLDSLRNAIRMLTTLEAQIISDAVDRLQSPPPPVSIVGHHPV